MSGRAGPFSSVAQWCPTLCNPTDYSTPGLPVHHQLLEPTETGEIVKGLPIFMPERKALRFPQLWDYKKFPLIVGTLKMILNNLKTCAKWPPGILLCFSDGSVVKNSPVNTCQCRGGGFDPSVSQIPRRRKWQPTQYFCLENPKDRGACQATVHGVPKSQTWLSN